MPRVLQIPRVQPFATFIARRGSAVPTHPVFELDLSPRAFMWLWLLLMLGHLVSIVVLVIFVQLYWFLGKPEMTYFASFSGQANVRNLRVYAVAFALTAVAHALVLLGACVTSLQRRSWSFAGLELGSLLHSASAHWSSSWHHRHKPRPRTHHRTQSAIATAVQTRRATRAIEVITRPLWQRVAVLLWNIFLALFSVKSRYFYHVHVVREMLEVAAQVYQAYWASNLVSHSFVNHTLAFVVVANSWGTPLARMITGMYSAQNTREMMLSRVLCLAINAALNAVTCMVVPLMILGPLWRDFDFVECNYPPVKLYDDAYFARITTESQMIIASSYVDCIVKMIPLWSMLLCFLTIQRVVVQRAPKSAKRVQVQPPATADASAVTSIPPFAFPQQQPQHSSPLSAGSMTRRIALDMAFLAVGLTVLMIHIVTYVKFNQQLHDPLCTVLMAPWLATKYPCAVYNYDCAFLNTTTPAPGSLAFLDEHVLVTLNFVHCSALVMLPEAQRFKQLLGFNLKHVTLIDWSRAAAITPDCFPYMVFLCLAYVNLTKIPDGMLGPLPPLLQDIEFTHTNLSVIPDDLYEHWPSVGMLYFEFSGIQQVPDTLTQMPLFDFSLIGNQIHNVSILAAMPTIGVYVSVDLNPITTLPMAFDQAEVALVVLSAEHTQLADASEQLLSKIRALYAAGTPLCASEAALDTTVVCDSDYARASGKCFLF